MTFQEQLEKDVRTTFLNPEEFGEIHIINGKEMVAIIDNNEQIEREKRTGQQTDGLYRNQKLVYVAASDFGPLPSQGSKMILDGETCFVDDAISEGDVYSITISRHKGRGWK